LAKIFADHHLGLLRLATLLVGDEATAEDVVQDAFTGLHEHWDELRTPAAALPYVRAAVVNGSRSALRRRAVSRRRGISHETPAGSAESVAVLNEERREVLVALERLPPRRREVLVLRYFLDLTDAEISVMLNISQPTVRSTAARALAALARAIGKSV
jgi:RNA polymerase sigma-70 factor (sigma-E family)